MVLQGSSTLVLVDMQHIEMAVVNCSSVKLFICSRLQLKNVLETSVPRHFWMEKNCSLFLLSLHIWTFSIGTGNVKTGTVLDTDVKNLGLISNPFYMGTMTSRGAVLLVSTVVRIILNASLKHQLQ